MRLIIGLGNPGEEYKNTRHNIGRAIVEKCAKKNDLPDFEYDKKSNTLVTQGKIGPASAKGYSEAKKEKVVFALPETFMNKSGLAVSALAKYYKIKPEQIFIAHDDVDLPVGRMKISFDKSSAGHKGVENVMKNLKTQKFWRVRIGIGTKKKTKQAMELVLKKFSAKENEEIKKVVKKSCDALVCAASESPQKAMTVYNQS